MIKQVFALLIVGVALTVVANGAVIVETDWDADEHSWGAADTLAYAFPGDIWEAGTPGDFSGVDYDPATGNPAGSFGGLADGHGASASDIYISTADGVYSGNYQAMPVTRIDVDIYSDSNYGPDASPAELQMFFVYDEANDTGDRSTWYYDILDTGGVSWNTPSWQSVAVPFGGSGWYSLDAPLGLAFADAMQDIDRIGLYVGYRPGIDDQIIRLDNFALDDSVLIPEPGTYMFLGFAFVSLGVTFRRKLTEVLAKVKK